MEWTSLGSKETIKLLSFCNDLSKNEDSRTDVVGGGINSRYTKEVRSIGIGQRKNRSGDDVQVFGLASWVGV